MSHVRRATPFRDAGMLKHKVTASRRFTPGAADYAIQRLSAAQMASAAPPPHVTIHNNTPHTIIVTNSRNTTSEMLPTATVAHTSNTTIRFRYMPLVCRYAAVRHVSHAAHADAL